MIEILTSILGPIVSEILKGIGVKDPAERLQHDRKIFQDDQNLLDEKQFRSFIAELMSSHCCFLSQIQRIDTYVAAANEIGRQYLRNDLNRYRSEYVTSLIYLREMISVHFYVYPMNPRLVDPRTCLEPELNGDRAISMQTVDANKYFQYVHELEVLIERTENAFTSYRKRVKQGLWV